MLLITSFANNDRLGERVAAVGDAVANQGHAVDEVALRLISGNRLQGAFVAALHSGATGSPPLSERDARSALMPSATPLSRQSQLAASRTENLIDDEPAVNHQYYRKFSHVVLRVAWAGLEQFVKQC